MSCNRKYLNLQWTTINQIIKIIVWFIASKLFGCLKKKLSVCSVIYPLATISIPLWFHLFLRIVLRHSGRRETFVAELQYQIAVLNLSVLRSRWVSFQMPKKVFIIFNFSTLCWSVPESNFIFPTNAKVTWKY